MRKITKTETYGFYNELSEIQQKKEIENLLNDTDFLKNCYENLGEDYLFQLEDIKSEISKTDGFIFDDKEYQLNSSSQGWYFDRFSKSYLQYENEFDFSNVVNPFTICINIDFEKYKGIANLKDINYNIYDTDAFEASFSEFEILKNIDLENLLLDDILDIILEKDIKDIFNKGKYFTQRIVDNIKKVESYYVTEDEAIDFCIESEKEFLIESEEV